MTSINFGNIQGGLANAGREGMDDSRYIITTENFEAGTFIKFALGRDGVPQDVISSVPGFDCRQRSWFSETLKNGASGWSSPEVLFTGQDMFISANSPVYNSQGGVVGVFAINLFLSQVADFLAGLEIGDHGGCFIMEPSGYLIASSSQERPFSLQDGGAVRLRAQDSGDPLIRSAADALAAQGISYRQIEGIRSFSFDQQGKRQWGRVFPFGDHRGLDWLVVTVIPEDNFLGEVKANNRRLFVLAAFLLGVVSLFIFFAAQKILAPLESLAWSTAALGEGDWDSPIEKHSRIREIGILTRSFNRMYRRLGGSFAQLKLEVAERKEAERKLQEKNEDFAALNEELRVSLEEQQRQNEQLLEAEEEVQKQLDEKEILLKEVHHRIKNNIAAIESLLSLQVNSSINEAVKTALREALTRVQSMRILYDKLLLGKGYRDISLRDYLVSLIEAIAAVSSEADKVTILREMADCQLSSKKLVPLGIIVNELLTNAFKYAFQGRSRGTIGITLTVEDDEIVLVMTDDGNGLDDRAILNKTPGFGLTIVQMLAEQLGGTFEMDSGENGGTRCILQFRRHF